MPLYSELPADVKEVDVIIGGGGTAGCIVAARLAEADSNLSILVIEGGANNEGNPIIQYPAFLLANMSPESKTNLFIQGVKEDQLGGREVIVPTGGTLGGGSSTNFMMYSRASKSDYDGWGAPGWSTDDLLPLFKKIETYHGPGDQSQHGLSGPIHVSTGTFRSERSQEAFMAATEKAGQRVVEDAQAFKEIGTQRALSYISPEGARQDTASGYILPRLKGDKHPNLHILVQHQVVRVLFDQTKRAVGVEFQANPLFQPDRENATRAQSIKARRLVVLSSGALGTPQILERSGVGNTEILNKVGVNVLAHLPGVGEGYQDHPSHLYPYKADLTPEETLDIFTRGELDFGDWIKNGEKRLGWNVLDVSCKWRPDDSEVDQLGPDFRAAWDRDFKSKPDRPLAMGAYVDSFPGIATDIPRGQYVTISNFITYPYSRGSIHITSPDLSSAPDLRTGFLSDPQNLDLKVLVWAYKKSREIARRMSIYRGEVRSWHPPFPPDSAAACKLLDGPVISGAGDISNIEYTPEDDAIIERFLVEKVSTSWHSLGTCKMAPLENGGVVDKDLNVYGVGQLKLADLSIAPGNVGAHTNNTAMVIGEKAADIILREFGLQ
ncbi:GMC oxidoreductase domain containing protein [Naviculisporaceae sp. PSN 640]